MQRNCPVCMSCEYDVLFTQRYLVPSNFPLIGENNGELSTPIVSCNKCKSCFSVPEYDSVMLELYYNKFAQHSQASAFSKDIPSQFYNDIVANCIDDIDLTKKILDVGSGNGELLKLLFDLNAKELTALDISTAYKKEFESKGIRFIEKDMSSNDHDNNEKFDYIFVISVLEHVLNLSSFISGLQRYAQKGAVLVISVPDVTFYGEELSTTVQQINLEHINHFCLDTLVALMSRFGFHLKRSSHVKAKVADLASSQLLAVFKYDSSVTNRIALESNIEKDYSSLQQLELDYCSRVNHKIQDLISSQVPIAVVGVGNFTFSQLAISELRKCNIQFFVDVNSNKQGANLIDRPILDYQSLSKFEGTVVISNTFAPDSMIDMVQSINKQLPIIVL